MNGELSVTTSQPRPDLRQRKRRPPRTTRIVGYVIAAMINTAFVWLVNVAPGWRSLPLLSDDFRRVVGVITLSLVISVVVNLIYVVFDPPWMRRLGDAFTTAVGFVVMLQLVQIFPFDFTSGWAAWESPFRILLGLGCVGTGIGVITNLALFARDLGVRRPPEVTS